MCSLKNTALEIKDYINKINNNIDIIKMWEYDTIEQQQHTIQMLTEALCEKYNTGLIIVSDGTEFPLVIRNGKKLIDDMTTSFSIKWNGESAPDIQIS